jgi:hypothetical protein
MSARLPRDARTESDNQELVIVGALCLRNANERSRRTGNIHPLLRPQLERSGYAPKVSRFVQVTVKLMPDFVSGSYTD